METKTQKKILEWVIFMEVIHSPRIILLQTTLMGICTKMIQKNTLLSKSLNKKKKKAMINMTMIMIMVNNTAIPMLMRMMMKIRIDQ
jgi:hypothetical protein